MVDIDVPETFVLESTNVEEVRMIFNEILKKNSAGYDGISVRILECWTESALHALACSNNRSFAVGEFPKCLKDAVVVPLFKGGDMGDPSNFRPISLLFTLISKVIEKIVKRRLLIFLKNNILCLPVWFSLG